MNKIVVFLCVLMCSRGFADSHQEDVKGAISTLQERILQSKNDATLLLDLALLQLKDQQEYESLVSFVHALDNAKLLVKKVSEEEKKQFLHFLERYFEGDYFYEELETETKKYPEFFTLRYFLASKLANERKFEQFFTLFFSCYCSHPDHYMADKARGVLASLLLQKEACEKQKCLWRKEALKYFKRACEKQPNDLSIHSMLIVTASREEKKETVAFVFQQIFLAGISIPRTAIPTYVSYCLDVEDAELANLFLQKAATWYEYSRVIQQMQQVVTQSRVK